MSEQNSGKNTQPNIEYQHSAYATERRYWYDWIREQSLFLDKSIVTLSSGAIGLTLIFVKDFVSVAQLEVFPAVVVCWVLYVVAIICVHQSQSASQEAAKYIISELDSQLRNEVDQYAISQRVKFSRRVTWLNRVGRWSFYAAIAATFVFVVLGIRAKEIAQ